MVAGVSVREYYSHSKALARPRRPPTLGGQYFEMDSNEYLELELDTYKLQRVA
jgi:hypothetical protein